MMRTIVDNMARDAGLVPVAEHVYATSPTRVHEVLVVGEGDGWVAWAGYYHRNHGHGRTPMREWMLCRGMEFQRALTAAKRFARRLRR